MPTANPLHPPTPNKPGQQLIWENLHGSALGLALSKMISENNQTIMIITPDILTAERIGYELRFFLNAATPSILHFPDWETLPYDFFSPHQDIISGRLATLHKLSQSQQNIVITPITTLMHRLCPRDYLDGSTFLLQCKDTLNLDKTRLRLESAGYRCVNQVREHGEFAIRGSILDLFPMGAETPYRIDLFDDEIDSIRTFSPETQRSIDKVAKIELLPAKEFPLTEEAIEHFRHQWRSEFSGNPLNSSIYQDISEGICPPGIEYYLPLFFATTATLFDYLPKDSIVFYTDEIHHKAEESWQDIQKRFQQYSHDLTRPLLTPQQVFTPVAELFGQLKQHTHIKIQTQSASGNQQAYHFASFPLPDMAVNYKASNPLLGLADFIHQHPGRILFCAESVGRREVLLTLFNTIHLQPKQVASWEEFLTDTAQYCITVRHWIKA